MIDWNRVSELCDEVGREDFSEIVELFLEEVDETMQRLAPGMPDLEGHMHFLKGSALNLGFDVFAQVCQAGEMAAGQGNESSVDLDQIAEIYAKSRAEFNDNLDMKLAG